MRLLRQAVRAGRRRPLRAVRWLLLLPGLVAGYLLAAFAGGLWLSAGERPGGDVDILLIGSAIHYDFLLPATPEVRAAFAFAQGAGVPVDADGVAWILVGWGARDFYTATGRYVDMRPGPVWRAVTGDTSVLRVEGVGPIREDGLARLSLSQDQFSRLVAGIVATRSGPDIPGAGFTETDAFFEARDDFHILRTCNTWVGKMLRDAGLAFGRWTPTPQAVRLSLSRLGAPA